MGFFDKLFGRKKPATPSAGEMARERLTLMLVHDRLKLTPDLLDRIKEELLAVISKYVEIDETGVDVELTHTEHSDKLVARMPVRRQRLQFQRDVLEPGMGNPLAAAAALADIHQPPASASAAPAETHSASAPTEAVPDSPQPAAESASPEPANAAPVPAAAEITTPPSDEGRAVREENAPAKAEDAASTPAQDKSEQVSEGSAAEPSPAAETAAERLAPEANVSPTPAAEGAPAPEVPASATTLPPA
jgi:cell division topological specificity factor